MRRRRALPDEQQGEGKMEPDARRELDELREKLVRSWPVLDNQVLLRIREILRKSCPDLREEQDQRRELMLRRYTGHAKVARTVASSLERSPSRARRYAAAALYHTMKPGITQRVAFELVYGTDTVIVNNHPRWWRSDHMKKVSQEILRYHTREIGS